MPSIRFLGAAGTVTGSRFLVDNGRARVLVDCGLFQGLKELRLLNWEPIPFDLRSLDSVVLTHAHLDHTGYLPRLTSQGYEGPVFATPPTVELCGLLLPDSGHLQEEQAEHANSGGYSKHSPALPLYTSDDAFAALGSLRPIKFGEVKEVAEGVRVRLSDAGHILGSSIVEMWLSGDGRETKLVFSGDLGRYGEPLLADPTVIEDAGYLLVESTYGDREHTETDPSGLLAAAVVEAFERRGCLLIPAFAVGRTQQLLYELHSLQGSGLIPDLPVFVDSPMATDATAIFLAHPEAHRLELQHLEDNGDNPLRLKNLTFVRTARESMDLDEREDAMIIISASGMATGGRVLHHLANFLPDPKATVLFVGFQAAGTRGRSLLDGVKEVKMLGQTVPVAARIKQIDGFSAHADKSELLQWLGGFRQPPQRTFVVHGEDDAAGSLAAALEEKGWKTTIPRLGDSAEL